MSDPFDLARFMAAQQTTFEQARRELLAGRKQSHWVWFVFPQLRGLGRSEMAHHYGIGSMAEAQAYAAHPVLGPRLVDCTRLVLAIQARTAREILGSPDDLKLRSSMTLFALAAPGQPAFRGALDRFFAGVPDEATLGLLRTSPP